MKLFCPKVNAAAGGSSFALWVKLSRALKCSFVNLGLLQQTEMGFDYCASSEAIVGC